MMEVRPIRNAQDYDWALQEIAQYFENEPDLGSPEADRFDVLATLIEAYEAKHWPIDIADPIELIRHVMAAKGLQQADLAGLLQSRSRASELLAGRRNITLQQAARLHNHWGVPARPLLEWPRRLAEPNSKTKPSKKPVKPSRAKNMAA